MAKKMVHCRKCENRAIDPGVGFARSDILRCVHFDMKVDKDDGCTFGSEGDPTHKIVRNPDISIGNHEIVYGNHDQ